MLTLMVALQMSAVGITENAKGDNKKFEIWCNSREEVYIVQVRRLGVWVDFFFLPFSMLQVFFCGTFSRHRLRM